MRQSSLSTGMLLFTCLCFLANPSEAVDSDAKRLAQLNALRDSSNNGLISLSIDSFETVIEAAPRSYAVLVMFSAPPALCQPCPAVSAQLAKVATDYSKLSTNRASSKPLFFAEVKLSPSNQEFLAKYSIQHVPILYHFSSGRTSYPQPLHETSPNYYHMQHMGIGANSIKEFVNQHTGSRLKVVRANYQIPFVQTVRTWMPVILSIVAALAAIAVYTGAYKNPMLWFGLVVLVYIFSVGGGHYSWIHNVPLAVVNKEGKTEYVASGSRSQYVAEGFFVSATCVSISVLVILIQELPSVMPSKAGQTVVGMGLYSMTVFAIVLLLLLYQFVSVTTAACISKSAMLVCLFP